MQPIAETTPLLAIFNLGGGEIILLLTLVLILAAAGKVPGLGRFFQAARRLKDEVDQNASAAGRSVGGIYGKPAAQALTPDNHVAELYDPAAFRDTKRPARFFSSPRAPSSLLTWLFLVSPARNPIMGDGGESRL